MNKNVKIAVIVVCLLAAGVVVAMNMGLFGGESGRSGNAGAAARQGGGANNAASTTADPKSEDFVPTSSTPLRKSKN
ncbi:MAG: hypothetical protein SFZ24_05115 [Planctomycetota bacterium]|nr:hypothetical protein [Planctomycetota bacterium]